MGQIVEFDKPYNLLSNGQGFFFDMVQQLGKTEFDHLLEVAHRAAKNRSVLTSNLQVGDLSAVPFYSNVRSCYSGFTLRWSYGNLSP